MSEEDLLQALTSAVICTILAKAGPQRSRILANLYKVRLLFTLNIRFATRRRKR